MRQKLNMVIGVFFSEVGTAMIGDGLCFVQSARDLMEQLRVTPQWQQDDFRRAARFLAGHEVVVDSRQADLNCLKEFLMAKRGFMLSLLENPNLLEHDEFTDLLWAVFHLIEELEARHSLAGLPATDMDHLSGDIKRAYTLLLREWVTYVQHLKKDYPYLFSLAVTEESAQPGRARGGHLALSR